MPLFNAIETGVTKTGLTAVSPCVGTKSLHVFSGDGLDMISSKLETQYNSLVKENIK